MSLKLGQPNAVDMGVRVGMKETNDDFLIEEINNNCPLLDALPPPGAPSRGGSSKPSVSDMMIATSTVPGYVSWRSPDLGSYFIQDLCHVGVSY